MRTRLFLCLVTVLFSGLFFLETSSLGTVLASCQNTGSQTVSCTTGGGGCGCGGTSCSGHTGCTNGQTTVTWCSNCSSLQEARDCACGGGGGGPPPTPCGYCACTYAFHSQDCPSYACGNEIYSANCNSRSGEGCLWIDNTGVCTTSCTGTYPNGTCIDGCNNTIACTPPCTPTTCAAQGKNCGTIDNGCGTGTLNCGSCTPPYTCGGGGIANVCGGCNITLSASSLTVGINRSQTLTATVSNVSSGATVNNITWSSANSGVASVTSPGASTTVTGVSPSLTTVTATANLSPGGSCTTNGVAGNSNPTTVNVIPTYFVTFGGDVTAKGRVSDSNLPAGKYISGSSLSPVTKSNGQSCNNDSQCTSSHCANGVCCNTACTGSTCQRCDSYSNAGTGTCGFVSTQVDPNNECTASANTCSGNNVVTGASGNCSGTGYACDTGGAILQTCTPTTATCKTGGGCANGSCTAVTNVPAGQDPYNQCTAAAATVIRNQYSNQSCSTMCASYQLQGDYCNGSGACTHAAVCQSVGVNSSGNSGDYYDIYESLSSPWYCWQPVTTPGSCTVGGAGGHGCPFWTNCRCQ